MHSTLTPAPCVHPKPENNLDSYSPLSFEAMGCRFEMLIGSEHASLSRADCAAVCEQMRGLVFDWHARLSVFEPNSIVSQFNRANAAKELPLDDDLFDLYSLCDRLRTRTEGAFNIASGTLMQAHGFREGAARCLDGLSIEEPFVLDATRRTITKTDDRIMLDFGAIAKGFVLDLIRVELDDLGVTDAFVHGGTSSVLAIGQDHNLQAWTSRIGDGIAVSLQGMAMGVSEGDSRVISENGRVYGHVMDPRTMCPASNSIRRAVCVHSSAAAADVYSTACCVSPDLIARLSTDPCTLILFEDESSPILHDPLGVVHISSEDHHDRD